MVTLNSIKQYRGATLKSGVDYLYIPPHALLRPYISHYTVSFPTPHTMSDEYTVLPSASSTICISVDSKKIVSSLSGTNTKAEKVGMYANKMKLLLLIKFRSGGFFHFFNFMQTELTDYSLALYDIDRKLMSEIENGLEKSEYIHTIVETLDTIFIKRLKDCHYGNYVSAIINKIISHNGSMTARELSTEFFYSEKHIRRLFSECVGTTPKMFIRIVRVNNALHLLRSSSARHIDVAAQTGFFDQPHFIHDFKTIFGLTPQRYIGNMSDFYNDEF